jgi:cytochrome P450/deferrochelatase/peroxidase EfeB
VIKTKYYARIRELAAREVDTSDFDFARLGKGGGLGAGLARSRTLHALLRIFWPVGRIGRFGWVVRHADVADVRRRSTEFIAPYGEEMVQLTGGANFLLGMKDGPDYRRQLGFMRQVMRPDDVPLLIGKNAQRLSEELIACCAGEIDAVEDYLFRVAAETCADYFGLEIEDPIIFAQWLMSLSALLFADYTGEEHVHQLALAGAGRVRRVIDAAIARSRAVGQGFADAGAGPEVRAARGAWYSSTIVGRLVQLQLADPVNGPSDAEIRAIVMGTAVGYVPTGGGAGGNILNVLLGRPQWLARAQKAASEDDDALLGRIIAEAMRFAPPIDPGLPRYVDTPASIGKVTFPKGASLLVASAAAMFDGRVIAAPGAFDPDRDLSRDLQFGGDFLHYCLGDEIARTLLVQSLKPLLRQDGLRRAPGKQGKLATLGPFPQHLTVTFRPDAGERSQAMVTICVEVSEPVPASELEQAIDRLGNPALPDLARKLDDSRRIHFASLSAIPGERSDAEGVTVPAFLVLELTADGASDQAIDAFVEAAGEAVLPVFALGVGVTSKDALARLLRSNVRQLVAGRLLPGKTTASGVNFPGTPELSVQQIHKDCETAAAARACLDRHIRERKGRGGLAMPALKSVREQLRAGDLRARLTRPACVDQAVSRRRDRSLGDTLASLATDTSVVRIVIITLGLVLSAQLLLDPRIHALFATPGDTARTIEIAQRVALSGLVSTAAVAGLTGVWFLVRYGAGGVATRLSRHAAVLAGLSVLGGAAHFVLFQSGFGLPAWDAAGALERAVAIASLAWRWLVALAVAFLIYVILAALAASAFVVLLNGSEAGSPPEDHEPDLGHVNGLLARENAQGHVQNHLIAVTPLKTNPRWFRRFTLGLAFWGIQKLVQHRFRAGFVLDIGTIHYARWFRLPKTDKLIFLSNYDGSWESYLEDFITKAHLGQSAVWSNGVGFPKTRLLLFGGAADGARFKRWVRRQQIQSRFWYTRFPQLTTDQMRNNALICEGLAKARTESEAQAWIDLFGSRPRPPAAMEHEEIQSIVFSGMGKLHAAELIPLRIPDGNQKWQSWLLGLIGGGQDTAREATPLRISFGASPPVQEGLVIALSAAGLRRFGLDQLPVDLGGGRRGSTLDTFPVAFLDGMASERRAHILGDLGDSASANWPWAQARGEPHAVLIVYARDAEGLARRIGELRRELTCVHGFELLPAIRMRDRQGKPDDDHEPFGFRDGVSQPVMRGARAIDERTRRLHQVEPGEFVLGYPDNRGDAPPTPRVAALEDAGYLPSLADQLPDRFPSFTAEDDHAPRDLGRNGSFLVIRQLEQDTKGFHTYTQAKSDELRDAFPGLGTEGNWVAARMVGRWPDGSSLVRHPLRPGGADNADNDFLYGPEDPQGLNCPYGAHIRRAFPRDSQSPESADQLSVSNRHRLMRRGRPYVAAGSGGGADAEGILFMCLNADIERQFEFVQQTWLGSANFHGLSGEPDPIAASRTGGDMRSAFTMPTTFGPMTLRDMKSFVTVRNGGYFFLPSWSALRFLATLRAR